MHKSTDRRYWITDHYTNLTFELHQFANQPRQKPYLVDWRSLPSTLLETARGGDWSLDVENHPRRRVKAGEVILIPAEVRHRLELASPRLETTWALVSYRWDTGQDAIGLAQLPHIITGPTGRRVAVLLQELASSESMTPGLTPGVRKNLIGFKLLRELSFLASSSLPASPSKELVRMQPAIRFIHSNLNAQLNRETIAATTHLSPTRFHAVFKDAMGIAPMEYVLKERLKRAREMLLADDEPIYHIASACGFNSAFYFCRLFRKRFSQSPGEFRKEFRRFSQ